MKRLVFILFTVVLLTIVCVVTAHAQKVTVEADPGIDVSKYKTYAWAKPLPPGNPYIQKSIIDGLEQALASKGLTKVEENAEVTLTYYAATNTDIQISHPSWSHAMGSALGTGIAVSGQSWPVTKGMLVVDIADAGTKGTVWRGSATQTLEHGPTGDPRKDAKSVEKPIRKAIEKMFKKFPRAK
jgi:hypothetical protein